MATHVAPYPNVLRVLAKNAGYSFREIQEATGIPKSTLFDWAAGNRPIPHKERKVLARLLCCSPAELAPTNISTPTVTSGRDITYLVQYSHEQLLSLVQSEGYDMNKTRRLLLRIIGAAGIASAIPLQPLLDPEPWQEIARAKPSSLTKETLYPFQKLTETCWELTNGSELAAIEQLLPMYLPHIAALAQPPSENQPLAASIVAQGHLLGYVIASNREDFMTAFAHCQQARVYGQMAHDPNLETIALIRQGVVGLHRKRPYQTLGAYEEALQFVGDVSPLIRTRLHASLCEVQGKLGMEQEARRSIGLAQESFPTHPVDDPASLYIHFSESGLYLHEGLALLDLHKPDKALDVLLHIDGLHPKIEISERSRIDVLNQQARAAGTKGDLEQFHLYLENAVTSALKLGSELRYSEAWNVYEHVRNMHGHVPLIKNLNYLFAR